MEVLHVMLIFYIYDAVSYRDWIYTCCGAPAGISLHNIFMQIVNFEPGITHPASFHSLTARNALP